MRIVIGLFVFVAIFFPITVYGHGYGVDTITTDEDITISVEIPSDFELGNKQITITAMNENVQNITYLLGISHEDNTIFSDQFFTSNNILTIDTIHSNGDIQIHGLQNEFGAWYGDDTTPLEITGPVFSSGGLYTFEISIILLNNEMINSDTYYADLTLVDTTEFIQSDLDGEDVKFRLKSYFDEISNFEYDPIKKQVTFEMPFDWRESRMSHIPVVHEEVHFPKDFAEFLYPSYDGQVNGIDLFKASISVDDYTEDDERIVHFVLLQDHLRFLKNQQKGLEKLPDSMVFTLSASDQVKFPLTAFTKSEDFQVDLSWDPIEIEPGVKTNFIFTIRDGATGEPMRNSDYKFVILQNGQEIYRSSGQAQVGGDFETYEFTEDQTGSTIIRFEDIRNSGQETEFGFVVVPEFSLVTFLLVVGMVGMIFGTRRVLSSGPKLNF